MIYLTIVGPLVYSTLERMHKLLKHQQQCILYDICFMRYSSHAEWFLHC